MRRFLPLSLLAVVASAVMGATSQSVHYREPLPPPGAFASSPQTVDDEGLPLLEGDMLLTDEQRASRKASARTWPGGFVPYVITSSSAADQAVIRSAFAHWRQHACIKPFEMPESYSSGPHLRFIKSPGCWSYVGRIDRNSGQNISIDTGCNRVPVIAHEIGHALGFWHEQSRGDRDSYISVLTENIDPRQERNFRIRTAWDHGVPYDLTSLMHYSGFFLSRNGKPTMVTNDLRLAGKFANFTAGLSHRDAHMANLMYNCDSHCDNHFPSCAPRCRNGGYISQHCSCVCPPGTSGPRCENVHDTYYGTTCGDQEITQPGTLSSRNYPALYPAGEHCVWVVTAPVGKRVRIQFATAKVMSRDGKHCYYDWISLHLDGDSRPEEVACGTELQGSSFTSSGNRLALEMHSFRRSNANLQTGFNSSVSFV